jgi:hypothetical protein
MIVETSKLSGRRTYQVEGGGWLVIRQDRPELSGRTSAELLALTRDLPGNLRYTPGPNRVQVLGELPGRGGELGLDEGEARLGRWLDGPPSDSRVTPADEVVEAVLETSGLAWSRRERGWAVPAAENCPRELRISAEPGVVRVEAVLADWDEIGGVEAEALARFLYLAQPGLRCARCELHERQARISSVIEAEHLETELVHGLRGVAAGCRLLARETTALLVPEMARALLEFQTAAM